MNLFKDQCPESICVGGPKDEKHVFCFVFFPLTQLCMIYASKTRHGLVLQYAVALRTLAFLPPTCGEREKKKNNKPRRAAAAVTPANQQHPPPPTHPLHTPRPVPHTNQAGHLCMCVRALRRYITVVTACE